MFIAIKKGTMNWKLGWAIPLRTVDAKFLDAVHDEEIIEPDRTKPFSHLITGCALRALSAHPEC
jgi:hypothetical protein